MTRRGTRTARARMLLYKTEYRVVILLLCICVTVNSLDLFESCY